MTDKNLSDKVQEIATAMREAMRRDDPYYSDGVFLEDMSRYIRDLENLSSDPPLPTLADMTRVARYECKWMQCDVEGRSMRYVIANPLENDGEVTLIDFDGGIDWVFPEYVTPRPDLPRLKWPSADQKVEDVPTVEIGDVIESADDPRLDALPAGSALLDRDGESVAKRGEMWAGLGYTPIESEGDEFGPWKVLHIGQGADQ